MMMTGFKLVLFRTAIAERVSGDELEAILIFSGFTLFVNSLANETHGTEKFRQVKIGRSRNYRFPRKEMRFGQFISALEQVDPAMSVFQGRNGMINEHF